MYKRSSRWFCAGAGLASVGILTRVFAAPPATPNPSLKPTTMPPVGTVDERYQSYNVEMLEVTGGKFWKPYGPDLDAILKEPHPSTALSSSGDTPPGMNPALYQYRPAVDLTNARLRILAAALGPAYVRVSGTWANASYFPETDEAPTKSPPGFMGILTRQQWKGVVDFSKAVNAEIVTSFANSAGMRDATGLWTTDQAKRFVDYTKSIGGRIAAAEFMNEPTLAAMGGAPAGYDAAAYGRDFKVFCAFAKQTVPTMLILGPGSVGETTGDWGVAHGNLKMLKTLDLLAASGPGVDRFSYHHYGAASVRCAAMGHQTTADSALSDRVASNLSRPVSRSSLFQTQAILVRDDSVIHAGDITSVSASSSISAQRFASMPIFTQYFHHAVWRRANRPRTALHDSCHRNEGRSATNCRPPASNLIKGSSRSPPSRAPRTDFRKPSRDSCVVDLSALFSVRV